MSEERKRAIIEDIDEAETPDELEKLVENMIETEPTALDDPLIAGALADKRDALDPNNGEDPVSQADEVSGEHREIEELHRELQEIQRRLEATVGQLAPVVPRTPTRVTAPVHVPIPMIKKSREIRYRLMSDDVSWSTVPQVHALMAVLVKSLDLKVGDEFTNEQAVAAMTLNKEVLNTRQEPRRIWDYYKGNSNEGLMAHGVIVKL